MGRGITVLFLLSFQFAHATPPEPHAEQPRREAVDASPSEFAFSLALRELATSPTPANEARVSEMLRKSTGEARETFLNKLISLGEGVSDSSLPNVYAKILGDSLRDDDKFISVWLKRLAVPGAKPELMKLVDQSVEAGKESKDIGTIRDRAWQGYRFADRCKEKGNAPIVITPAS